MSDARHHRLAEERSLAAHRVIADRLDATALGKARERVQSWLDSGTTHPLYASAWREVLDRPLPEVKRALVDPDEQARALRQCSPFSGALPPRERWRIWREVRESMGI